MGILLYSHNEQAYRAALSMLAETGKAAVVHPTGTGKSFIGFKLCEDNPDKTVLWLSPSEYIFKTQLENLKAAGGGEPKNIRFLTYAKLMLMGEGDLAEIQPAYIVLDEFHRAGAEMWGAGVKHLLELFPGVPVLGLSATAIRYLDNQRDMAEELFDGNVASEMTLGEAIVRGILNPPKYVISVFSYQKDLEKYERRVKSARNRAVRDAAEKYLEALRRALEKADGLDVIFDKHMTDRTGKYIVFCANKEHMDEMMEKSGEWFAKVDSAPHIYSVYAEDPSADKSFADFKADDDNTHLRLLYCIDALNEGIHVENVSGVILLRPTVSPIIYKQQIGRALSASKKTDAVIFDVVNNIAGLYSIDAIEEEMREVIRYYRYLGEDGFIVNDRFSLIDEVRDCRGLFDELENALSASWDFLYAEAKLYYKEHGDLLVPQSYITESGSKVVTQRINYRGGKGLTPTRIEKLERIGMCWQTLRERQWDEGYALARAYHAAHGDLEPAPDMSGRLCSWLSSQRCKQREGLLSPEQFRMLDELGMVWEFEDTWETKFECAKAYYEEHGNLDIPAMYVTDDGVLLGSWYRRTKDAYQNGTLSEERKKKLESIGMNWTSVQVRNWTQYYEEAKRYFAEHGDLHIHAAYVTPSGLPLGTWITTQRYHYKTKKHITDEQIKLLEAIGMSWNRFNEKWEFAYAKALALFRETGDINVPCHYQTDDGFRLGTWIANQRAKYAAGKLKRGQIDRLNALRIKWEVIDDAWQCGFAHAKEYKAVHGDLLVPNGYVSEDGYKLGAWIANQKTRNKDGRMTDEQRRQLDEIGMVWAVNADRWKTGLEHMRAYCLQNGHGRVPKSYVCEDGYALGEWFRSQERRFRKGILERNKIVRLAEIGVRFRTDGGERAAL